MVHTRSFLLWVHCVSNLGTLGSLFFWLLLVLSATVEICRWRGRWKTAGLQIWRYQRLLKVAVPQSMWLFKAEWRWTAAKRTGRQETKWRWASIPWGAASLKQISSFNSLWAWRGKQHSSCLFKQLCTSVHSQQDLFDLRGHSRNPSCAVIKFWEFLVPVSSVLCCRSKSWGND